MAVNCVRFNQFNELKPINYDFSKNSLGLEDKIDEDSDVDTDHDVDADCDADCDHDCDCDKPVLDLKA